VALFLPRDARACFGRYHGAATANGRY